MTWQTRFNFVSFGGGVQSSAIALLCLNRDERLLEVTGGVLPDRFLFADTGDEPQAVYDNVESFGHRLRDRGFEFDVVCRADYTTVDQAGWRVLSERLLRHLWRASKDGTERNVPWIPAFVRSASGGSAPLQRRCTFNFKVETLDRAGRRLANVPRGYKGPPLVRRWLGISRDEASRMKDSPEAWSEFFYPLVEMGWRRSDCESYLSEHGESVPRSACYYCPFHSDRHWQEMRDEEPEEFARAVSFERELQAAYDAIPSPALRERPYLHQSLRPLDEVDFAAQGDLFGGWGNECAGVCGV